MRITITKIVMLVAALTTGCAAPSSPTAELSTAPLPQAVHEDGKTKDIQGDLSGSQTRASTTVGFDYVGVSGNATHLGKFTYTGRHPNVVFTAANGDTITATATTIASDFSRLPLVTFRERLTVTGGTGRFEGASGEIILDREGVVSADRLSATLNGTFEGTIHTP